MKAVKKNWRVFRKQGFVLKVPDSNIHAGYYRDFGSGLKKNKSELIDRNKYRTYFAEQLNSELNLSDKNYNEILVSNPVITGILSRSALLADNKKFNTSFFCQFHVVGLFLQGSHVYRRAFYPLQDRFRLLQTLLL